MIFSIRDGHLVRRTVKMGSATVERVSIYPCFNLQGKVEQVMLILGNSSGIYMIPHDQKLIKVGMWGNICIRTDLNSLETFRSFSSEMITNLYHFDSDRTLRHPRFEHHWANHYLNQSNCIDRFSKLVVRVSFSHDLLHLKQIVVRAGYKFLYYQGAAGLEKMNTETRSKLLKNRGADSNAISDSTWYLEPIWEKWGKARTRHFRSIRR